jgi:hypothetical protein
MKSSEARPVPVKRDPTNAVTTEWQENASERWRGIYEGPPHESIEERSSRLFSACEAEEIHMSVSLREEGFKVRNPLISFPKAAPELGSRRLLGGSLLEEEVFSLCGTKNGNIC